MLIPAQMLTLQALLPTTGLLLASSGTSDSLRAAAGELIGPDALAELDAIGDGVNLLT